MNTKKHLLFFALICSISMHAQNILTLENAIEIALKNNYDIKIAKNELNIDEINNSVGNAGMLPNVNLFVNNSNSLLNTTQTQADGKQRTQNGAKNMSLNYGIGLDWTIFDGFKMFAKKEQLNQMQMQGETEMKRTIYAKISNVYHLYYQIVLQELQIAALDTAMQISIQRLNTAQNRYSIGKASKLEVLNAQVDLNADSSLLLQQKQILKNVQIQMNELLAQDVQTAFKVQPKFAIDEQVEMNKILDAAVKQNPDLQYQILTMNIAEQSLKQVKANRYPVITVTTGYNFTQSEAALGFITQSNGRGLNYGFTAAMPIYSGSSQIRNEKIAKIQIDNSLNLIEKQKQSLRAQIYEAYENYRTNLSLIQLEANNIKIAEQNIDITLAKFNIGTITNLEFRTAQQRYVETQLRYSQAQFQTKIYEIKLKELAGSLKM